MENSPLELITYFYTAFNIQTNMDEDKLPKEFPDEPTVDVDWNVSLAGEGNKFLVSVSTYVEWDDDAGAILDYIEVVVNGIFWLPDDMSPELVKKFVPLNCVSSLLGIVRGSINNMTSNFPGGAYILPLVNLVSKESEKTLPKRNPLTAHVNENKAKPTKTTKSKRRKK